MIIIIIILLSIICIVQWFPFDRRHQDSDDASNHLPFALMMTMKMTTTIYRMAAAILYDFSMLLFMFVAQHHIESRTMTTTTTMSSQQQIPKWLSVIPDTNYILPLFSTSTSFDDAAADDGDAAADDGTMVPTWRLDSLDQAYTNLTAIIPGDLLSDLIHNHCIEDPYYNRNFLTQQSVWTGNSNVSTISRHHHYHHHYHHHPRTSSIIPHDGFQSASTLFMTNRMNRTWIYSTMIQLPVVLQDDDEHNNNNNNNNNNIITWQLVVEGIKMGAIIQFNGIPLGVVQDQFLRYRFPIEDKHFRAATTIPSPKPQHQQRQQHVLEVIFDPTIPVDGRYMACSGGWDWAPYAKQVDVQGIQMFTLGLVQPIYLVGIHQVAITNVVPKIYYQGQGQSQGQGQGSTLPQRPMIHGSLADFHVQLDIHMVIPQSNRNPSTSRRGDDGKTNKKKRFWIQCVDFTCHKEADHPNSSKGKNNNNKNNNNNNSFSIPIIESSSRQEQTVIQTVTLIVPKDEIELWWPNGMGKQPLYTIIVGIGDDRGMEWGIPKRIGTYIYIYTYIEQMHASFK